MNPCTCGYGGAVGRMHATFCPAHTRNPFPDPTWEGFRRQGWGPRQAPPDPERSPEGMFEGMSRAGLSQLADSPVATVMRINGHTVWRWEESSPVTRILSDARPEGEVILTEEWMMRTPDLGGPQSPLRAAMMQWAGLREWSQEPDLLRLWTVLRWRPKPEPVDLVQVRDEMPGTAITTYAGVSL